MRCPRMTDRRVKGLKIDNGARSIVELMVAVRLRTAAGAPGAQG